MSAICASASLDGLVSESSNNKDSSLSDKYQSNISTSSSSNSNFFSVSDSSGSRFEMCEVGKYLFNSYLNNCLRIVAHIHDQMETGIKDRTIQ